MSNLKEKLEGFYPKSGEDLRGSKGIFATLAETFLYGGYISVSDYKEERYRIFIRTVEFYCHYEGNETYQKTRLCIIVMGVMSKAKCHIFH